MTRKRDTNSLMESLLGMLQSATQVMILSMLEVIDTQLVDIMRKCFPTLADQIDDDYVTAFACALYTSAISFEYGFVMQCGGIMNTAYNELVHSPDECTPTALLAQFREGFSELSPTMAAAVTEDMIIKIAKLLLLDWLQNGEPESEAAMIYDTHFYFHEVMKMDADVDSEAVLREGKELIGNMTPEQLSELPDELIAVARDWQPESEDTETDD